MPIYRNEEFLEAPEFPFNVMLYVFSELEITQAHSHEFVEFVYVAQDSGIHVYL